MNAFPDIEQVGRIVVKDWDVSLGDSSNYKVHKKKEDKEQDVLSDLLN